MRDRAEDHDGYEGNKAYVTKIIESSTVRGNKLSTISQSTVHRIKLSTINNHSLLVRYAERRKEKQCMAVRQWRRVAHSRRARGCHEKSKARQTHVNES